MSTPDYMGPQDPEENIKFIGVMVTRAKKGYQYFPEGSYYVRQGAYTLEVLQLVHELQGKNHPRG
eukprot:3318951-Prorocentrum_lima.AAC.1